MIIGRISHAPLIENALINGLMDQQIDIEMPAINIDAFEQFHGLRLAAFNHLDERSRAIKQAADNAVAQVIGRRRRHDLLKIISAQPTGGFGNINHPAHVRRSIMD